MADISYEQARGELRDVVAKLESGGQTLEDSLALWERGELLADICQRWLDQATARLDEAIAQHDTAPTAGPTPS
ncbi:MAG: exodeoxyribonuclease VII small subunit [Actinomycetota bacterium]|nr:exodeoxyribonuclease VII small subunit [Actinomycetota bacterium]